MDLHLSKGRYSHINQKDGDDELDHTYEILQAGVLSQRDLDTINDGYENLCEIQVDNYRVNNRTKREFALNCEHGQTAVIEYGDKVNDAECLSIKFQSDIWPTNAFQQRENFFKYGVSPTFELKGSPVGIEKMINHQNGKIKFNYFYEAKRILEYTLRKYKTLDKFVLHAFGKTISISEAKQRVRNYLVENGIEHSITVIWSKHLICSAQMCSNRIPGKKREREYTLLIKGNHENTFIRENGMECLLNHEIGTHYVRSFNDSLQLWYRNRSKFNITPLKSYEGMKTEEGLACIHTILQARIKYLCMPALLYYCSCMADYLSFKQLFDHLSHFVKSPEQRWKHCMRIKRVLKITSDVGGYGKDQRYFEGAVEILRNIDKINFKSLICGKVVWTDLPNIQQLLKKNGTKLPKFMDDYDAYIKSLHEIANLNGLTSVPESREVNKSREEVMKKLGVSEDQLNASYHRNKTVKHSLLRQSQEYQLAHNNGAGGDIEWKVAKLCGCSLFSGIRYDTHLDLMDIKGDNAAKNTTSSSTGFRQLTNHGNNSSHCIVKPLENPMNVCSSEERKRIVPVIFELNMQKPII